MNPTDTKVEQQYGGHDFGSGRLDDFSHGHTSPPTSSPLYGAFNFTGNEPMYTRSFEPAFSAPPILHPLNTNETTLWPSQITNPSSDHISQPVPLPVARHTSTVIQDAPISAPPPQAPPPPAPPARSTPSLSTARRTLSDDDRRRMCKYHDENPSVKQTEIGGECGLHCLMPLALITDTSNVRRRAKVRTVRRLIGFVSLTHAVPSQRSCEIRRNTLFRKMAAARRSRDQRTSFQTLKGPCSIGSKSECLAAHQ